MSMYYPNPDPDDYFYSDEVSERYAAEIADLEMEAANDAAYAAEEEAAYEARLDALAGGPRCTVGVSAFWAAACTDPVEEDDLPF